MARMLAEVMSQKLKQQIVVENIPGAGGAIGARVVAKSKPDGYKILFTTGGFVIAPLLLPSSGYDPVTQFTGVRQIAAVPLILVVKSDSQIHSMTDLIAQSKLKTSFSYASFGVGTPSHIAGEAINQNFNVKITHIPYSGSSKALPDIQSGNVNFGILDASFAVPMIQQGVLRAIAVTGHHRLAALPNTPTLTESGVPFDLVGWYGVFVPTSTPADIVNKLKVEFDIALSKTHIKDRILNSGLVYIDSSVTPSEWTKKYREEMRQWDGFIKKFNITND
jgi:tripartite-type tricarboxylate transporter receptor subunit TctC